MTDNNKFIPKIPETKTEIILNQEQQSQQEQSQQKSTTEKVLETFTPVVVAAKETIVPSVHASDEVAEGIGKGVVTALNTAAVGLTTAVCPPAGAALVSGETVAGAIMSDSEDKDTQEAGQMLNVTSAVGSGAATAGKALAAKSAEEAAKKAGEGAAKGASQS